jgi:uncharacterized protein YabN with tetrapyrrole methylase and pyrophosphatase domain
MNEELRKVVSYTKREMKYCPWLRTVDKKEMIRRLKMEIRELEHAKSKVEIMDEAGDVAMTALKLMFIVSREHGISKKMIIRNYYEKMKRRKPHVVEGRKVSNKESKRVWEEAKRVERESKGRRAK